MVKTEFTFDPPVTYSSAELRGSWCDARRVAGEFKERWVEEYLVSLRDRQKWGKAQTELYEGQLVLISGPDTPRTHWNLGRVEGKVPANDQITRRYKIRMPNGNVLEGITTS